MIKYKLKKDLPFAKAGTVIKDILHCRGTSTLSYIEIGDCKCELDANKINIFDWIEEIKPREFWVTEHKNDQVGVVNRLSICKEKPDECPVTNCETIKVREIVE